MKGRKELEIQPVPMPPGGTEVQGPDRARKEYSTVT